MAIRHGNKQYFQILLDPNRAELVQQEAAKNKQRATAWIREAVYSELKRIAYRLQRGRSPRSRSVTAVRP